MKRRNLLAGLGVAIGGGTIVRSGAFTSVEGERDATIEVATDSDAYVSFDVDLDDDNDFDAPNDVHAVEADDPGGDAFALDFNNVGPGDDGYGPNPHSDYEFDNVFGVKNEGTQAVGVYLSNEPESVADTTIDSFDLYVEDNPDNTISEESDALEIGVGEKRGIGVKYTTDDEGNVDDEEHTMELIASSEATN